MGYKSFLPPLLCMNLATLEAWVSFTFSFVLWELEGWLKGFCVIFPLLEVAGLSSLSFPAFEIHFLGSLEDEFYKR